MRRHTLVRVLLGILLIGFTADGPAAARVEESSTELQAGAGILPVPDYSGDWLTRRVLTGDWGGLRQRLANRGLTLDVEWTQTGQEVASGGRDTGSEYSGSFDYVLTADLMRMGVLPGALMRVRGESRYGDSVNSKAGQLLPVNTDSTFPLTRPLDNDVAIAVTELTYVQFLSEQFGLLGGKIQTMDGDPNEFAGGRGRYQFMNLSLVQSPVLLLTVPYSTLAAGAIVVASPQLMVSSMFMNRTDASTTTGFGDFGDGTTWATEADAQYRLADLPGGGNLGFIYSFEGDFRKLGRLQFQPGVGLAASSDRDSWAGYGSWWQYLFARGERPAKIDVTDGRPDLEGIGLFARVGRADEDTNPVKWAASAGLGGRGLIPTRGEDTYGVGYFHTDVQEPETIVSKVVGGNTDGVELFYRFFLTPAVDLTVDGQWSSSPFKRLDDAYLLGLRLNIRL